MEEREKTCVLKLENNTTMYTFSCNMFSNRPLPFPSRIYRRKIVYNQQKCAPSAHLACIAITHQHFVMYFWNPKKIINENEKATDWIVICYVVSLLYTMPDVTLFRALTTQTQKLQSTERKFRHFINHKLRTPIRSVSFSLSHSLHGEKAMCLFVLTLTCVCVFWLFVLSRLFTVLRPFNNLANVVLFFVSLPSAVATNRFQSPIQINIDVVCGWGNGASKASVTGKKQQTNKQTNEIKCNKKSKIEKVSRMEWWRAETKKL